MTATNHVLTGTLIGLTIHQPFLAIPLALISHFVLDMLPHYGNDNHIHKHFITVLGIDIFAASLVLLALATFRPLHWQLALACAIIAASPDLMWLAPWLRELRQLPKKHYGKLTRFHKIIQRFETPKNYPYELLWAGLFIFLIIKN